MGERVLICLLFSLLLCACGPGGNNFRLRGSFRDMKAGEIYVYNLSNDNARLDTLTIRDGEFLYKGQAEEPTPYILVFPNGMEQVVFVGPGEDITYEATANDLKNYVVNGSDENKLMNSFRQETYTMNPTSIMPTVRQYINDNASSPVATYLFDTYFVNNGIASDVETSEMLKLLMKQQPDNRYLASVQSKLTFHGISAIGQTLPDVNLQKRDKSKQKLWSKSIPYTLVTFWSLWMPNGYDFMYRLRGINSKYKDDGNLRVVAISLDAERGRWEDNTRIDSVSGIEHYFDGMVFDSEPVRKLGIGKLPTYIITDKHHKVLAHGNDMNELNKELEKYVK